MEKSRLGQQIPESTKGVFASAATNDSMTPPAEMESTPAQLPFWVASKHREDPKLGSTSSENLLDNLFLPGMAILEEEMALSGPYMKRGATRLSNYVYADSIQLSGRGFSPILC